MKRRFDVEFREDHIHVKVKPDFKVEPEEQEEFWRVLRELGVEHDSRRVLIEDFVPMSEHDPEMIIDAGMRTSVIPNMWLAFCLKGYEINERSELFEVIAAQHHVRAKFFSDTEAALRWLRVNAPK